MRYSCIHYKDGCCVLCHNIFRLIYSVFPDIIFYINVKFNKEIYADTKPRCVFVMALTTYFQGEDGGAPGGSAALGTHVRCWRMDNRMMQGSEVG